MFRLCFLFFPRHFGKKLTYIKFYFIIRGKKAFLYALYFSLMVRRYRMRVRDLRYYFLAGVVLIIAYAALAVCYYLSIRNGKVESSMMKLGLEAAYVESTTMEEKVDSYYNLYYGDTENKLVSTDGSTTFTVAKNQTGLASRFKPVVKEDGTETGKFKPIFAQAATFDEANYETTHAKDQNYYFYYIKDDTSSYALNNKLVVRIAASTVLEYAANAERQMVIFDADGAIEYTTVDPSVGFRFLVDNISTDYGIEMSALNNHEDINIVLNIGDSVVFSATYIDYLDAYYGTVIVLGDNFLGIDWVIQQAVIYFVAGVIVTIAMLGIMILGVRKCSQLLRADRHAVQATKAMVLRIDPNGKIIFTNKTFKQMYGVTRKLLNVDEFIDVETNEPIIKTIKENKAFECKVPMDLYDEENVKFLHLSPLFISNSYYLMGTDITIDYRMRKHLEIMSGKNSVTKCDNGFTLENQFEKILENNQGYNVAFVEINITKHADIIQVFGKTVYNQLLIQLLDMIKESFMDHKVYHIDESKFMVIVPNDEFASVQPLINEFLDLLQRPITVKANNIYLKSKIVIYNVKSTDFQETKLEDIRVKLDLAYRNMTSLTGKDYIIYEPTMDGIILAADEMEHDIEMGLIGREFQMWLQPQFDVFNNRIDGFEALIRWMNPKYRDKSPQLFIELAEQRGHMLDIGKFVITESFKLAKKLEPYGVHVSINVSPVQLLQVGFVQQFNSNELKKGSIAVEITETLLMGSMQLITEKLRLLREAGFHIHLDDFCTGYSSMLYLKDLPVDTLKIDKEFTKYIETNKVHENIVKTICALGNALDLNLICEGVETQEQSDMVKKMGCRVIQGWLIGKAMPYDDAVELLEKYNTKSKK